MQIRNLPRSGQLSFQGTLSMCQVIKLGQPQNLETRIRIPESGFRNQKPESGIWNPESGIGIGIRNRNRNRNPESGIRNQKSTNQRKQVLQIPKFFLAELLPVENKSSNMRTFRDAFDNEYYCTSQ